MDKDNCYNLDRIFCTKIITETCFETFSIQVILLGEWFFMSLSGIFHKLLEIQFNINKFIYKIKPSYNLHSQCGKWSCQNRRVVNVFNVGTKTMECMGQSPQN